jgi:hypothetical protein
LGGSSHDLWVVGSAGDSYIMMNTYMGGETKDKKMYDIHFWIGAESSQDEYGVAAYKTVELDDLLGGDPIQHRECMDHETDLFMSYFPDGITLMEGGIESGFRKVGSFSVGHAAQLAC